MTERTARKIYIIEVYGDGTADYCKVNDKKVKSFYTPEKYFGPWSKTRPLRAILAGIQMDETIEDLNLKE